jgi:hypothetical protein
MQLYYILNSMGYDRDSGRTVSDAPCRYCNRSHHLTRVESEFALAVSNTVRQPLCGRPQLYVHIVERRSCA